MIIHKPSVLVTILSAPFLFFTTPLEASPWETNDLHVEFQNEAAQAFGETEAKVSTRNYGPQNQHRVKTSSLNFFKKNSRQLVSVALNCYENLLFAGSAQEQKKDAVCEFVYRIELDNDQEGAVSFYTRTEITKKVSKKIAASFKWSKSPTGNFEYFGCWDNRDSGCPAIVFSQNESSGDYEGFIRYLKP